MDKETSSLSYIMNYSKIFLEGLFSISLERFTILNFSVPNSTLRKFVPLEQSFSISNYNYY